MGPRWLWRLAVGAGRGQTRLRLLVVGRDSMGAIGARPGRSALTVLGTLIGVGAFVATVGLSTTARAQVGSRFNALEATEVVVQDAQPTSGTPPFSPGAGERARSLPGVVAAGSWWQLDTSVGVTGLPDASSSTGSTQVSVLAASPGAFSVIRPTVGYGRVFDEFAERSRQRVAVVGRVAAQDLGIDPSRPDQAIFVGGVPFSVIGFVDAVERQPEALLSVIIPDQTAASLWGMPHEHPEQLLVATRPGAAQVVGTEIAAALRPADQVRLEALVPPDPAALRQQVNGDLTILFLVLAAVALLVGLVSISNSMLVAVLERVPEIGLRRAIGAQRREIALQFLLEGAVLGSVGGLVGACGGLVGVVAFSFAESWTAVLPAAAVLAAPLLGTAVGVLAGLYPAHRASRLEPVVAIRR